MLHVCESSRASSGEEGAGVATLGLDGDPGEAYGTAVRKQPLCSSRALGHLRGTLTTQKAQGMRGPVGAQAWVPRLPRGRGDALLWSLPQHHFPRMAPRSWLHTAVRCPASGGQAVPWGQGSAAGSPTQGAVADWAAAQTTSIYTRRSLLPGHHAHRPVLRWRWVGGEPAGHGAEFIVKEDAWVPAAPVPCRTPNPPDVAGPQQPGPRAPGHRLLLAALGDSPAAEPPAQGRAPRSVL